MAAEIIDVCDALVTAITNGLTAPGDAAVSRVYLAPVKLQELSTRKVYVFPASYDNGPITRGEDEWTYAVVIVVTERYTTAGEPTNTWVDGLVEFVQDHIVAVTDYSRAVLSFGSGRELRTTATETLTYDPDQLAVNKLFWSEVTITFSEFQAA